MSDELLDYYNRELAFVRRMGAEFAEAYPKIAGRLRLAADTAEDPHVERLIEAFALLNARIRRKLDDDFPEISDSLLSVLYPHYLAPIPAMSVAQFVLQPQEGKLSGGYEIPRQSLVQTDPIQGEPCRFRTAYPVTLWPIDLVAAEIQDRPFAAPPCRRGDQAPSVLRLQFRSLSQEAPFSSLEIPSLRFYLRGQAPYVYALYETLLSRAVEVSLATGPGDASPVALSHACLRPVGFEPDEGMLPYSARSMLGYRLLTEFFAFPQKFLFVDLAGIDAASLSRFGSTMEVFVYFDRPAEELARHVSRETFQLGCTPIVNLFSQRAEPIRVGHTQSEYRVVPDARRPRSTEVFSIDRVEATSPDDEKREFRPFYGFRHAADRTAQTAFWHASRRPAQHAGGQPDEGTEVYLSLVDLEMNPSAPADWTLQVHTTCLNRDLPRRLPYAEGQLKLHLAQGGPLSAVRCLVRPTPTYRPALRHGAVWRLISHLALGHASLVDDTDGASALREILSIYDFAGSAETRAMIGGVLNVSSRRVVGRAPGHRGGGICRGLEVSVHFDEDRFSGCGVFLFASVLERFLGLYCTINSFSRMVATTNRREGELKRWAPRAGQKILL